MPDLPVLIGQTQRDGDNGMIVRAAQETVGNTLPNTTSVYTQDLSGYFHFDRAAYLVIGNRFGEAMQGLLGLDKIPETLPAPPSELMAEALPVLQVRLNWTNNANNADGIYIERSISPDADFGVIAVIDPNTTGYTDWSVGHDTTYYYKVHALNEAGYSAYSQTVTATTDELIAEAWVVYPIPTDDHLEVILPSDDILVSNIELVNLDGKQISSQFKQEGNQIPIDFSGTEGAYFLRVHTQNGVVTHRIWKQ